MVSSMPCAATNAADPKVKRYRIIFFVRCVNRLRVFRTDASSVNYGSRFVVEYFKLSLLSQGISMAALRLD
jgi:hypothetical protein